MSVSVSEQDCMRMKWENLSKDLNTKLQLLFNTMQEEQLSSVHNQTNPDILIRTLHSVSPCEHVNIIFLTL